MQARDEDVSVKGIERSHANQRVRVALLFAGSLEEEPEPNQSMWRGSSLGYELVAYSCYKLLEIM